ncbi:V-type ATPase 116kDa subunit family protein [Streptomyces sp. AK02-04a]|uniref:V-type ATPase 116kDa subunit family protein n=1 Tax=Streptomyces sp. AK02-04a TaxID=3028649 RepID=UPI0029A3F4E7|nr:V-type ATPase 116kDa subunit family protein [Streptomyces sp. AK02-04a]MDX3758577.1 V-type ATPase 116kDa subunit family protein [Streptomyces sp. AK02-04a]
MPRPEVARPVRMQRVAIVAPQATFRDVLVRIAEAGNVEIDRIDDPAHAAPGPAARRLRRLRPQAADAVLCAAPPDLDALEEAGRADLLAGEAQLEERIAGAVRRGTVAALAGWCPAAEVHPTAARLTDIGGVLVPLPTPGGTDPPTLLRFAGPVRRSFAPLVRTYGTVPYADVDPTLPAGIVYVVMFGVMFGDAGHGALLLLAALLLCLGRPRRLAPLRRLWPFVAGAGLASTLAGIAYGEFFGPTGVLPVLWLNPLDQPMRLLAAAVALGAVLLALSYGVGTVNRWREGGPANALYAASGIAGAALFLGLALLVAGAHLGRAAYALGGAALALTGLALAGSGLFTVSAGGVGGAAQTGVQLFDIVVRIGSNVVSFARLAAFGLTHAALGEIVWHGTTGLADRGPVALLMAVLVFTVGNALAFALEALVAGVQALRLEFYELFSRVFETQGRPFRPWQVPVQHTPVPHTEVAS